MIEQLKADMLSVWDSTEIERFDSVSLERLGLGGESLRLLVEAGLPHQVEYLFETTAPALTSAAGSAHGMVCIGTDGGAAICIEPGSGGVHALALSNEFPSRFVNSSLRQFMEFLTRAVSMRRALVDLPEEEAQARVQALVRILHSVDPPALNDRDHWWAVILEQVYDGLL